MARTSVLWPIDVAIASTVESDVTLGALLSAYAGVPAIFSARAPADANYPRIVIADSSEGSSATFGRSGNEVTVTLHIWSKVMGRQEVLQVYERLVALLDGQMLVVTGHLVYRGRVRLVTILADPSEPLMHGVVEFSAITGVVLP